MDKRTLAALNKSIQKWENIAYHNGADNGSGDCALCDLFLEDYGVCDGCPVKDITGYNVCVQSPYAQWIESHNHRLGPLEAKTSEQKQAAIDELNFLKSLKPETVIRKIALWMHLV